MHRNVRHFQNFYRVFTAAIVSSVNALIQWPRIRKRRREKEWYVCVCVSVHNNLMNWHATFLIPHRASGVISSCRNYERRRRRNRESRILCMRVYNFTTAFRRAASDEVARWFRYGRRIKDVRLGRTLCTNGIFRDIASHLTNTPPPRRKMLI